MENKDIVLPQPCRCGGMPLMEALGARVSSREYSSNEMELQTLSDLLWAAWGFNRENKRTAPSSHNRQETTLYAVMHKGVYLYDARNNILKWLSDEDISARTGTQDYVAAAPLNVVLVAQSKRIKCDTPQGIVERMYADSGYISQNIYLFCASAGLSTVARFMVDKESLASCLSLEEGQVITLVQSVGYPL